MNYKNAFNCKECPKSNTEKGCPAWMELIEENNNGEKRIKKTCLLPYLPKFFIMLTKASNITTENVSKTNNTIADGFLSLGQVIATKRIK
jgi:hypothetical protein